MSAVPPKWVVQGFSHSRTASFLGYNDEKVFSFK